MRMIKPQVDRHVKVPDDKVALLKVIGLVFGTSIILEDKLEVGIWTSFQKSTDISTKLCHVCYRVELVIYLSSGHNCRWETLSTLLG